MYRAKKLAIVLATSLLMTTTSIEDTSRLLDRVPYIHHLFHFENDLCETRALIELDNEINA